MARISGVDIPREKQVLVSLQYIHGIGSSVSKKILTDLKIDPAKKVKDLTEEEVSHIREKIDKEYSVEGELRKEVTMNIKRLIEIGSRRGIRHKRNLPVRGQRTRTNARTKRGAKKTVAGRGQKRGATKK
ncbi:MAG: 30S ribosomal protein S13 [Dehalococcoidia bacterium]|jgi:small subunit ribosomal protein S13